MRPARENAAPRLIVFTRWPEPGTTKTRLIPALGEEGAASLQRDMTERTLKTVRQLASDGTADVEVRYEGGDLESMRQWLGPDVLLQEQGCGDLGERMARALGCAFKEGSHAAVLVGTDCPGLSHAILKCAFAELERADVVIGPATDGGYYLIGMTSPGAANALPRIFEGVAWGTGEVLSCTLRQAKKAGVGVALLEPLPDVDRPEDIIHWERARRDAATSVCALSISIVIPTLDEQTNVGKAVASANALGNVEVIVVDAGSQDDTVSVARAAGARVVVSRRGRGGQMNAGAAVAKGKILLFLHADTTLPEEYDLHVSSALSRPGVIAGAFEFSVDIEGKKFRRLERMINWRAKTLSMPYGDQALFVKARDFRRLGGFRNLPIMEDVDFVNRLHHWGRIVIVQAKAVTSGRRWRKLGIWRMTFLNRMAVQAFILGFQPEQIASWYRQRGV